MEPHPTISILSEPKQPHDVFKFFLNKTEEDPKGNFIHEFLCQPRVPLIGKYQHSDYSFGSILSLIALSSPLEVTSQQAPSTLKLPKEIFDYLNVKDKLEIDNNTKSSQSFFYPKAKVKFYFAISSSPTQSQSDSDQFNVVPHVFLNASLDFSKHRRVIYNTPMTLFVPKEMEQSSGVVLSGAEKNDIDTNNLRLEYSSIHLKGEALAFSPNNLRFWLKGKMALNHFYLLITQQESDYHHLFYYVVVNGKDRQKIVETMLEKARTLEEVITGMQADLKEESSAIVDQLKKLFH